MCTGIKTSMGTEVAGQRFPQIVRASVCIGPIELLSVIAMLCEIPVEVSGEKLVCNDGFQRRHTGEYFTAPVMRGPINGASCHLGLKDRRYGLRPARQPAFHPIELRSVQCRKVDHCEMDIAVVMNQLASKSVRKTTKPVLCAAISALKRNAAIGERRSDLDDRAVVPRLHHPESGHRAVDASEIRNFGDSLELFRIHLLEWREHRHHRIVDPDVDGTEVVFNFQCCLVHLFVVGDIGRNNQCVAAEPLDVFTRAFEPGVSPGKQGDMRTPLCKFARGGSSHARGCTCNYDNGRVFGHTN